MKSKYTHVLNFGTSESCNVLGVYLPYLPVILQVNGKKWVEKHPSGCISQLESCEIIISIFNLVCWASNKPYKGIEVCFQNTIKADGGEGRALFFPVSLVCDCWRSAILHTPQFAKFKMRSVSFHDEFRTRPWLCVSRSLPLHVPVAVSGLTKPLAAQCPLLDFV